MGAKIATASGGEVTFSDEQLGELQMGFRGALLTDGDPGFDEARRVENEHFDRKPGLVVRCTGPADVIDGVNLAREHGLLVAVKGGGHNVAGHSTTDGGLLLDLSAMNGVWVDAENERVLAQGGATWGDVDRESQAFGLAVPGGVVSTTGVGGLTLGGGIGWLHRKWGLACDTLVGAEVVTADGQLVIANEDQNPDLLWGLRGGGGNFGVVVNLTFQAHALGPMIFGAAVMYPSASAPEILPKWRDWASSVPEEITTRALFWTMPAADPLPPAVHDQDVLIIAALYAGDAQTGATALQPARELGEPLFDMSRELPYREFQADFDPLVAGFRSYWKSIYLDELTDDAIELICKRGMERPHPKTLVHVPQMGGATSRVSAGDTAFGDRSASWMLSVDGNWLEPGEAEGVIQWTRDFIADAENLPGAGGTYLNFTGDASPDSSVVQAQFGQNLERLAALKKRYDPDNLFRLNNNITPA